MAIHEPKPPRGPFDIFSRASADQPEGIAGFIASVVGLTLFACLVAGLFLAFAASTQFGAIAVGFVVFWFVVATSLRPLGHKETTRGLETLGLLCFFGALACVGLGGIAVFGFHAISVTVAGWLVTGLYLVGFVLGLMKRLSGFMRMIGLFAGAAMVAALALNPTPGGGGEAFDRERQWRVKLIVLDEDDNPIVGALANCAAAPGWSEGGLQYGSGKLTNDRGEATFVMDWTPNVTLAGCLAFKPATQTESGYAPGTTLLSTAPPGARLQTRITLRERTPPGSACTSDEYAAYPSGACATVSDGDSYQLPERPRWD